MADSGKEYRDKAFPNDEPLNETSHWRRVHPLDVHRIECDRFHMCGEQAEWATRSVLPISYVCDYHRRVFDTTGTFWKDRSEQ
jgi:hypothetical protein